MDTLDITTQDILDEIERLKIEEVKEKPELDKIKDEILQREIELAQQGGCSNQMMNNIALNYRNINQQYLKDASKKQLYNPSSMKSIMCMAESTLYFSDDISNFIKLKKLYHNLKQIGSESSFGVALRTSYDKMDDIFIVKAPQSKKDDNLIHELIVGIYGTNLLRNSIPNFSYIYGGFSCGIPIIREKEVIAFCTEGEPVDYVIYENIDNAISAGEYVKTTDSFGFLSMFLQIVYALKYAHEQIDFTHYDLHHENVLMRKFSEDDYIQIPYQTENGTEYLVTDRIATVIDYGMSHFMYNGDGFGITDVISNSTYPLLSHPYRDIYNFFMFCATHIYHDNKDDHLFQTLDVIFYFFNKQEKLADVIKKDIQGAAYYALPYIENKVDDIISYIRREIDVSEIINVDKLSEYPVLSCENGCMSVEGIIEKSESSERTIKVDDFLNFYDVAIVKGENIEFDYDRAKQDFLDMTDQEKNNIYNSIKTLESEQNQIDDFSFLYSYISILDQYTILLFENRVGQAVSASFGDEFNILDNDIADGLDRLHSKSISIGSSAINMRAVSEKVDPKKLDFLKNKVEDYYKFFNVY